MEKNRVFLDTSVLLTAMLSSRGGSFYILNTLREKCEFQINEYVLKEVIEVLTRKFPEREDLKRKLFLLLGWVPINVLPDLPKRKIESLFELIPEEDAPILASALAHSSFLLTLDNDFLTTPVKEFAHSRGLTIVKPKEFIQNFKSVNG